MRGEIGGDDTGSEGGDGESVKGVNESFTPVYCRYRQCVTFFVNKCCGLVPMKDSILLSKI